LAEKATEGEDVRFVFNGKIIALRPVEVTSTDYALQEYGLSPSEKANQGGNKSSSEARRNDAVHRERE
jgi:hypothetical protein